MLSRSSVEHSFKSYGSTVQISRTPNPAVHVYARWRTVLWAETVNRCRISSCCCVFSVLINGLSSDSVVVSWFLFHRLDCFRPVYNLAGGLWFRLMHFDLLPSLWAGYVSSWWTSLTWAGFKLLLWCGSVFLLSNAWWTDSWYRPIVNMFFNGRKLKFTNTKYLLF